MNSLNKLISLCFIVISLSLKAQTVIGDVSLPGSIELESGKLSLNGGGIREKLWIDLYVGGLYLRNKSSDANAIINSDEAMSIYIEIVSTLITSEKMIAAVDEGFVKSTKGNVSQFEKEIQSFKSAFSEPITKNDIYKINYEPEKGIVVLKNEKLKASINGHEFKKALFGIWFCDDPADEDLKDGMLGN